MYKEFEQAIKKEFKGYHVTMRLYPSGGWIEAEGFGECGTNENSYEFINWRREKGESIEDAILRLKLKLKKANELRISMEKAGASD